MNPSNLIARSSRTTEIGEIRPSKPDHIDQDLGTSTDVDYEPEGEPHQLLEDIHCLRVALAQMLARETGQDIQHFRGPVVDNARLCTIADNIWNHRRWSA
jgi:hypothetical protein